MAKQDMESAEGTYERFLGMLKVGTVISVIVVALVVTLLVS